MDRRLVNLLITPDGDFIDEKAKLTYMLITLSDIADSKINEANKVAEEASKLLARYEELLAEVEDYQERIKEVYTQLHELQEQEEE